MNGYKEKTHNDRLSTAATAKQASLETFRARRTTPDDPAAMERQANRLAISRARVARFAERKATRETEAAKQAIELAARKAELATQNAASETERIAHAKLLEEEQKIARDARYAARKARQGKASKGTARGR